MFHPSDMKCCPMRFLMVPAAFVLSVHGDVTLFSDDFSGGAGAGNWLGLGYVFGQSTAVSADNRFLTDPANP